MVASNWPVTKDRPTNYADIAYGSQGMSAGVNDRYHNNEDLQTAIGDLTAGGGLFELLMWPASTPNMTVRIGRGNAILGSDPTTPYRKQLGAPFTSPLVAAPGGSNNRIDLLVLDPASVVTNGTTANTLFTITGISSTVGWTPGMGVAGAGIQAGSTIVTVDSATQVTISLAATASATVSVTFSGGVFAWITGTAAVTPVGPTWSATKIPLGEIYVRHGATKILGSTQDDNGTDAYIIWSGPIRQLGSSVGAGSVTNASVVAAAGIVGTKIAGDAIDDTVAVPSSDAATTDLITREDQFAHIFKNVIGGANWYTTPPETLTRLLALATKTTTYTITATDRYILADASGGGFTITLPTAASITGREYTVIKIDSSANVVTIATTASQTINGVATLTLPLQWQTQAVISNGSNWIIKTAPAALLSVVSKSANYSVTTADDVITVNASGGSRTMTLPTAVGLAGKVYTLVKTDSSGNAMVIATTSSQTIDGAASVSTSNQWDLVSVVSDGANWISSLGSQITNARLNLSVVTKTGNYTATDSDWAILGDTTSGSITITLPAVSGRSGKWFRFKKLIAANSYILDGNASETIDGATTFTMTTQYSAVDLICDGAAWWVL